MNLGVEDAHTEHKRSTSELREGVFADGKRVDILDNQQGRGDPFELVDAAAVQVDVFWDAGDICSSCLFPSGLTPEDYLSGEVFQRGGSVHVRFTRSEGAAATNSPTSSRPTSGSRALMALRSIRPLDKEVYSC